MLDPEQNTTFHDNYIDMEYDLSKVLFIATANNIANIAPALRDRMEMINIPGYLIEEKVRIALDHLLPKQREAHGIKEQELTMAPEVVEGIIAGYTRESGVRSLDKLLAKIARARAKQIAFDEVFAPEVSAREVEKILGMPKFLKEEYEVGGMTGVVTGLAWTEVGGDILYIESVLTPGKGKVSLTGNLGDVMKESATIAHEWVMAHSKELGIDPALFEKNDINIHVPEGAIPKDGPSGRHYDGDLDRFDLHGAESPGSHRHDGRDDAPRPCDAGGRRQGEDSGGQTRRDQRADPLGGEPQGHRRDQARLHRRTDLPLREDQRRSAETGAHIAARKK